MIAPRYTAGHLEIDDAVADAVARDHFAQHDAERLRRHRRADAQFIERALEPGQMAPLVDQAPFPHFANLVDAVAELIAAILDMHHGAAHRQIAAVDIGYARHGRQGPGVRGSVDPQRLELAVQRRALHADELGGARNIAAETIDLRQ